MEKCNPTTMRDNLILVEALKQACIDFVPIPVLSEEEKKYYIDIFNQKLEQVSKLVQEDAGQK